MNPDEGQNLDGARRPGGLKALIVFLQFSFAGPISGHHLTVLPPLPDSWIRSVRDSTFAVLGQKAV